MSECPPFLRTMLRLGALICALGLGNPPPAAAKERIHTVYQGQRLGSIAKRYNVTVDELCAANGIKKTAPIKPGQKLVIPEKDAQGKVVPASTRSAEAAKASSAANSKASAAPKAATKKASSPQDPSVHVVARGHTLSSIAGRYGVSVTAICRATGITEKTTLKIGQRLVIPDPTDPSGNHARQIRLSGALDREPPNGLSASYQKYQKKPWRRGYVTLQSFGREWKGFVIGPNGAVLPQASSKINWALGTRDDGPKIDPRLVKLIAQVSDQFGGRPLRIVSGYRTKSFVAASKHKEGRALDFSVLGVPNEAVRDYLRTLPNVGVGYYPNSSFVHLDVRGYNAYWIDYAGPGEAPRKSPHKNRTTKSPGKKNAPAEDITEEVDHDGPPDDTAVDELPRSRSAPAPSEGDTDPAETAPPPPEPFPSQVD